MAKKKTTEKALNIDNILFNCRDYLRAARNSGSFFEKRDMMLTLVFLRFIGEKYEDGIKNLKQTLKEQGLDPEDENIRAAFFDDATFADGTYNLPPEARWSTIISTPAPQLNVALDTALQRLEEEDPQLKGCFVKGTFTARNLAANDIKKIVDEVNKISHKTFGEEKDLIGRVWHTVKKRMISFESDKDQRKQFKEMTKELDDYILELYDKIDKDHNANAKMKNMDFSRYPFNTDDEYHFYIENYGNEVVDLEMFVEIFKKIGDNLNCIAGYYEEMATFVSDYD